MNQPEKKNEVVQQGHGQQVVAIQPARLPYHPAFKEQFDIDPQMWRVLCESIFPSAKTIEGIGLAVRYCKAQGYDIMKKPVHVVPMWNSKLKKEVETVWPGIGAYRTTAARTGEYGGCDPTEYGPIVEKTFSGEVEEWENGGKRVVSKDITLKYHEWMRMTVYRIVKNTRCPFPGPKVYFEEIYSKLRHNVEIPNDRWQHAPNGQLEKCTEAAALRKGFPEVGDATAEEMEGKVIDAIPSPSLPVVTPEQIKTSASEHLAGAAISNNVSNDAHNKAGDPTPDADWDAVLDELAPGIEACKNDDQVNDFIDENSGLFTTINTKAPQAIIEKLGTMINKKTATFEKKK